MENFANEIGETLEGSTNSEEKLKKAIIDLLERRVDVEWMIEFYKSLPDSWRSESGATANEMTSLFEKVLYELNGLEEHLGLENKSEEE